MGGSQRGRFAMKTGAIVQIPAAVRATNVLSRYRKGRWTPISATEKKARLQLMANGRL